MAVRCNPVSEEVIFVFTFYPLNKGQAITLLLLAVHFIKDSPTPKGEICAGGKGHVAGVDAGAAAVFGGVAAAVIAAVVHRIQQGTTLGSADNCFKIG